MNFPEKMRAILARHWQEKEVWRRYCVERKAQCLCWLLLQNFSNHLWRRNSEGTLLFLISIVTSVKYIRISTTDRTSTLYGLAGSRCAVVHTFHSYVSEEIIGDTTRKWTRGGPLQRRRWKNRDHHSMRHLSPSSSGRRGKDNIKIIFSKFKFDNCLHR